MNRLSLFLLFALPGAVLFAQNETPTVINTSPRIEVYVETARQIEQIQQDFPYDITLLTAKGDTTNSTEALVKNGKPTILMFWLTTCVPCRRELTALSAKYDSWKEEADFNLYAISIDYPKNYEQFVKRVEESNWPFPAYYDLNREFGVIMPGKLNGLPQTFVLDQNGNIVLHKRRFIQGDEDALFEFVKTLL